MGVRSKLRQQQRQQFIAEGIAKVQQEREKEAPIEDSGKSVTAETYGRPPKKTNAIPDKVDMVCGLRCLLWILHLHYSISRIVLRFRRTNYDIYIK